MLDKGIYGTEFNSQRGPFGLRCGQMRSSNSQVAHNGGWYNHKGEKLGFGDLVEEDLKRIAHEIPEGEAFIVLGETDSFWKFVTSNPGLMGSSAMTRPEEQAPGIDYVLEHARYIVVNGLATSPRGARWQETIDLVRSLSAQKC